MKITPTNTGKVPNTSATAASSGSDMNGMAAQAAARKIKRRLTEFAAEKYKVDGGGQSCSCPTACASAIRRCRSRIW